MRYFDTFVLGALALWAAGSSPVSGETFTASLAPTVVSGPKGDYLSASFNFGTAFSQVESLRLDFVMPNGFEGTAASTGNSSFFR